MEVLTPTKRGGYRPGSGRKRGLASVKAEEARKYMVDRIASEIGPILTAQIEMAKGVSYELEDETGIRIIYQKLPDPRVGEYLLNQVAGKAKETMDLNVKPVFSLRMLAEHRNKLEK